MYWHLNAGQLFIMWFRNSIAVNRMDRSLGTTETDYTWWAMSGCKQALMTFGSPGHWLGFCNAVWETAWSTRWRQVSLLEVQVNPVATLCAEVLEDFIAACPAAQLLIWSLTFTRPPLVFIQQLYVVGLHKLFRSGQSERTRNPVTAVSTLPLGFFQNPRKRGSLPDA